MTAAAQRIVPASSMSTEALVAAAWRAGDLSWKLDPHQLEIYDAFNRWNRNRHTPEYVALCQSIQGAMDSVWDEELCRRFGKTAKWIIQLDEIALQRPGAVLTYGTAFQKDIGDIIVPLQNLLAGDAPDDVRPRYRGSYGAYSSPVLHFPTTDSVIKLVGIDKNPDGLRGRFSDGIVISEARDVRQLESIVRGILLPQFQRRPWAFLALESSTPKDLDHDLIRIFKPDATARGAYVMRTLDANKAISDTDREQYIREAGGRGHPECEREYFCKVTRDPERMIVPEFDREKHVRMVKRPAYAHCFVFVDPGMSDRLAILWGYWDWLAQMLVIERSWAEFNAGTDVVARVLRETEQQLWGRLPSSVPANDNANTREGLIEVEPHNGDEESIEALRKTLQMLPGAPMLARRGGRWFVPDGIAAYACENQGYVKRVVRAEARPGIAEAAYQAGAFLYWSPDKRKLMPNPLERWTDVDLRLAHDLQTLHGIHITVIDKPAGSADADVQQMRLAFQNDQVCILPDSGPLADELEAGKRKLGGRPGDWERSPVYGHYDCLAAGTMIETEHGPTPIEHVQPGDMVWTRAGLCRVSAAWCAGVKPTWSLSTLGGSIIGTANHRVWVNDSEWKSLAEIDLSDTVCAWESTGHASPSCSTGANTDATRSPSSAITACTSQLAPVAISIATFGQRLTGRSPTAWLSTIATTIRSTTRSTISSLCHAASTLLTTPASLRAWSATSGPSPQLAQASSVGSEPMSRVSFARGTRARPLLIAPSTYSRAGFAAASLGLSSLMRCSAAATVARAIATREASTTSRGSARIAGAGSSAIDTTKPRTAQRAVLSVSPTGIAEKVYDLTVEGEHEFFANGVLVHNCLASLKYGVRKVWISRSRNPFPPEGALLNGEAVVREPWAEYSQQSRSTKALNAVFGGGRVRR